MMSQVTATSCCNAEKLPAGNFGPNGLEMLNGFDLLDTERGAQNG